MNLNSCGRNTKSVTRLANFSNLLWNLEMKIGAGCSIAAIAAPTFAIFSIFNSTKSDISRLQRCQLTQINKKNELVVVVVMVWISYKFSIALHKDTQTQIHRTTQYAVIHICAVQDNNHSRVMATKRKKIQKPNRRNIAVTIECTAFRQLATNYVQSHIYVRRVYIRMKPQLDNLVCQVHQDMRLFARMLVSLHMHCLVCL